MGVCLGFVVAPLVHVVLGQEQMGGALLLWKVHTNLDVRQSSVPYSHIVNCIHLYIYTGRKMNLQQRNAPNSEVHLCVLYLEYHIKIMHGR